MLATIRLGIVLVEGNAQYAVTRVIMLRLAHMPGDAVYVVVMSMMLETAQIESINMQDWLLGHGLEEFLVYPIVTAQSDKLTR